MSVVDCRVNEGLEHGLLWTLQNTENWYWVSSVFKSIRRTGTVPIVDCRVYGGLVLIRRTGTRS